MSRFGKSKFLTRTLLLMTAVFMIAAMASAGWAGDADVTGITMKSDATNNIGAVSGSNSPFSANAYYYTADATKPTITAIVTVAYGANGTTGLVLSADMAGITNGTVTMTPQNIPDNSSAGTLDLTFTITGYDGTDITIAKLGAYPSGTNTPNASSTTASLVISPTLLAPVLSSESVDYVLGDTAATSKDLILTATGTTKLILNTTAVYMNGVQVNATGTPLWTPGNVKAYSKTSGGDVVGIVVSPDAAPSPVNAETSFAISTDVLMATVSGTTGNIKVAMPTTIPALATFTAKVAPPSITLTPNSRTFTVGTSASSASNIVSVTVNPTTLGNPVSLDLRDGTTSAPSFTLNGLTITANSSEKTITFSGTPTSATSSAKIYKVQWLTGGGTVLSEDLSITISTSSATPTLTFDPVLPVFYTDNTEHSSIKASVSSGSTVLPITALQLAQPVTATSADSVTYNGLKFEKLVTTATSPDAYITVSNVSGETVMAGSAAIRVYATAGGNVITKDLTIRINSGVSSFTISPTSMTFPYNTYTAQTLTITAPTSTIPPTVTAANTSYLTVGTVQTGSTTGTYTVTIQPNSSYVFGSGNTTTTVSVRFGSDTANVKSLPVTLSGSGSGSATPPDLPALTDEVRSLIAGVFGISTTSVQSLTAGSVSVAMPGSPAYENEIDRRNVAAYVRFSQAVSSGGVAATLFQNNFFMSLDSTGVGTSVNQQLPLPTSNADFHGRYDIVKVFGSSTNSVSLSLSRLMPNFFTYNPATKSLTANGLLIIADGRAPSTMPSGFTYVQPFSGLSYGVAYGSYYNIPCIVVFDGNTNSIAEDPIMMVHNYRSGSSGSGCAAGFGAFALVALGGIALLRRRNG